MPTMHVWAAAAALSDGSMTAYATLVASEAWTAIGIATNLFRRYATGGKDIRDIVLFYVMPLPADADVADLLGKLDEELPISARLCMDWFRAASERHSEDTDSMYGPA